MLTSVTVKEFILNLTQCAINLGKTASLDTATYMIYFIEFMLNQGVFPNVLKIAKVIPIFKSGVKSLTKNYTLVSLLLAFSKMAEKSIKIRIPSFINRHYMTAKMVFETKPHVIVLSY